MVYVDLSQTYYGWQVRKVSESGATLKKRNFTRKTDAKKYASNLRKKIR